MVKNEVVTYTSYSCTMYKKREFYLLSVENVSNALQAMVAYFYFRDISKNRIERLFSNNFAELSSLEIL